MHGHMLSHKLAHSRLAGIVPDGLVTLRLVFGANRCGYSITTTTTRWPTPFALRGGDLD
jgi:hypothetical protein